MANRAAYKYERVYLSENDLASWSVVLAEDGAPEQASGLCPYCKDQTKEKIEVQVVAVAAGLEDEGEEPTQTLTRVFDCVCEGDHSRPEGVDEGCGRWWLATLVRTDPQHFDIKPASDDSMLTAAQALDEDATEQEPKLRSAAEKWLAAVTALYGLFGLTGIAAGKDTVSALPPWGKIVAALLLLLGVSCAAAALYFGYRAAYGWPTVSDVSDDNQLRAWMAKRKRRADTIANNLKNAVRLAIVALAAVIATTACIWFWPSSPTAKVDVGFADGTGRCGELLATNTNGVLRLKDGEGETTTRPFADVRTMKVKSSC